MIGFTVVAIVAFAPALDHGEGAERAATWDPVAVGVLQSVVVAGTLAAAGVATFGCGLLVGEVDAETKGGHGDPLALDYDVPCAAVMVPVAVLGAPYLAVVVGDSVGPSRGTVIWPEVAFLGSAVLVVGGAAIAFVAAIGSFEQGACVARCQQLDVVGALATIAGAFGLVVGVPIAYGMSAVAKEPDDDGAALPGFFVPRRIGKGDPAR